MLKTGAMAAVIMLSASLVVFLPLKSSANSDVYDVLPADTHVLQYSQADFDGDGGQELAVLYTTGEETRLTLFKADSGRWSRWWDDKGLILMPDGTVAYTPSRPRTLTETAGPKC